MCWGFDLIASSIEKLTCVRKDMRKTQMVHVAVGENDWNLLNDEQHQNATHPWMHKYLAIDVILSYDDPVWVYRLENDIIDSADELFAGALNRGPN